MTDKESYRVWPDGTVQEAWESPYSWMSDDYEYVEAESPEQAWIDSVNYYFDNE
jgi:hypothetical protein